MQTTRLPLRKLILLSLCGNLLCSPAAYALSRIDQVNWHQDASLSRIQIGLQGASSGAAQPLRHRVSTYAKGSHIKVSFDNALLNRPIAKMSPRGIVKAAFVTQSLPSSKDINAGHSGSRVNLDLFLTRPGSVQIIDKGNGAEVQVFEGNVQADTASQPTYQAQSTAASYTGKPIATRPNMRPNHVAMQLKPQSSFFAPSDTPPNTSANSGPAGLGVVTTTLLSDGNSAVDLLYSGSVPDLKHFMMSDPPRIVIDMADTPNRTGQTSFDLDMGLFTTAEVVSSADRLRLILGLQQSARLEIEAISQGYRVKANGASPIQTTGLKKYPTATARNTRPAATARNLASPAKALTTIGGIDFRRTSEGQGRVIVKLNDPKVIVNFDKRGGELVANFVNATLASEDEKRLDVVDFATPVETVDLIRKGVNVQLVITPKGQFKHSVTQTESEYIVDVSPLSKREMLALEESETGYKGETLSLNFQKIPVRAALQVIADFTGLNIITSDSVTGDLSLRLNEVPWDQALDLILQTKNLSMRQKGNVIRVAPAAELAAQEKRAFEAQQEVGQLEPLVTDLIRVNYAKAEEIAALLKSVKAIDTGIQQSAFGSVSVNELKTEENSLLSARGSVTVDVRTNTLLLQDTPSRIRELRKLINKLDVPVKQIQIETRIVEATDDFSRSLGARLGFLRVTDNAQLPGSSDSNSIGTIFGSGNIENNNSVRVDNEIIYPDDLSINLPADPLNGNDPASYAYQIVKIGAGYLNLLDLELSALQAEGKGKIIANPKITTTDKHEARIEQGQERIFASGSLLDSGTKNRKAVLSLQVTPQVTPDDQVILDVRITNDSFAAADTLNTKRIETQILLRNGETVVIGGIYQQAQSDTVTKTPILGDIPVLGHLFKKRTKRDNRTELLIFLTPRIINPDFS